MIRTGVGVLAATALALAAVPAGMVQPASAEQKTVKIGFVSTFSGPTAAIGNDMRNAFELASTISAASSAACRSRSSTRTIRKSPTSACRRPRS